MDITGIDLGIAVLRALLAFIFFAHATQKILGWFSGPGPHASAALFEKLGQHPGARMVGVAAALELTASLTLLTGLLTPVGICLGVATMIVAGAALNTVSGKFWNAVGGGEYPFVLAGVVAALSLTGPGSLSLDAVLLPGLTETYPLLLPLAVGIGILGAVPMALRARRAIASQPHADTP